MINYSLSLIFGYAIAKGLTPLLPAIKTKRLHIHHWIWSSITLITLYLIDFDNDIGVGFLTGIALQGLSYKNWSLVKVSQNRGL